MHTGVDWGAAPFSPGHSLFPLPPHAVRSPRSAGLSGPAGLEERGASVRVPASSFDTSSHLHPCVPVMDVLQAPPKWTQPPCVSTGTCSQVRTRGPRPRRTPPCSGPRSCLLPHAPGSVASRFGVLFGERKAFMAGTLFALGLSILFPSKPFLESTVGTSRTP